ncbi:MAG: KH domain-containing protein [Candidatus Gracilibacteria bacterium]
MDTDFSQGTDRDFIEHLVKQIVDDPTQVEVTRKVDDLGVLITLKVGKFDMGKVIGKNGQTAKALRTLLRVIGSRNNLRVNLKIVEPDGSEVRVGEDNGTEGRDILEEDVADQHAALPDDLQAAA